MGSRRIPQCEWAIGMDDSSKLEKCKEGFLRKFPNDFY
jgi:hypothetical protein